MPHAWLFRAAALALAVASGCARDPRAQDPHALSPPRSGGQVATVPVPPAPSEPPPDESAGRAVTPADRQALDAAFAQAETETRGRYAMARATLLQHPAAKDYLDERLAKAANWRERFVAEVMLGWLNDKALYDEAHAWVKDPARRRSRNILGRVLPGELAEEVAKLGKAVTPHVLEMWLKTFEFENRQAPGDEGAWLDEYENEILVKALELLGDPRSYEPLLATFSDEQEPIARRRSALGVLVMINDSRVDATLKSTLADGNADDGLRELAARGLVQRKAQGGREAIEQELLDPKSSTDLQIGLSNALRSSEDKAARATLETALERAIEPTLVATLCSCLGALGDGKSIPLLERAVARSTHDLPREDCADAIRDIRRRGP